MTHPTSKETYFLLGRNKVVQNWSDGSATWSDFGGQCAPSEPVEDCAVREFIEESLEALVRLADKQIFTQSLLDEQYILKLELPDHIVYLVRFDWNPGCCYEFGNFRLILNSIYKLTKGYTLAPDEQQRLHKLGWFRGSKQKVLDVLQHPAVRTRSVGVDPDIASRALQSLGSAIGTRVTIHTLPKQALVIEHVDHTWLEKDKLQLFSTEQLRMVFCKLDATILLQTEFAERLRVILASVCFSGRSDMCEL